VTAAPEWYPFPDLAEPLKTLDAEHARLRETVDRLKAEAAATIAALLAETATAVQAVLDARRVVADLDDEQAGKVLRERHKLAVGFVKPAAPPAGPVVPPPAGPAAPPKGGD